MIGKLGAGEMAQEQRDAVIFGLGARRKRRRFVRRDAEPMHAGVDLQRRAALPSMGADEGVPFGKLGCRVDHRPRIDVDKAFAPIGCEAVEYVDGGVGRTRPHRSRFGEIGDKERLAARLRQLRRHLLQAETIGIGLDHGGAFDGEEAVHQRTPIRFDRGKIDGQRPAGLRRRRNRVRWGKPFCARQGRLHGRRYGWHSGGGKAGRGGRLKIGPMRRVEIG